MKKLFHIAVGSLVCGTGLAAVAVTTSHAANGLRRANGL